MRARAQNPVCNIRAARARNSGYAFEILDEQGSIKNIHSDEDVEKELNTIIDLGGTVEDVFVYHKYYGVVSAKMEIKTRNDVKNFIENVTTGKSSLLKNVTSGYHYHTVTAKDQETLNLIEEKLWENGFLATLKEHEPKEIRTEK